MGKGSKPDREPRVLVVSGDPIVLKQAEGCLRSKGYASALVSSGDEALTRLGSGDFEIILVDFYLPDMSGLRVLDAAKRKDPSALGIVWADPRYAEKVFHLACSGVFDFLVKPCSLELLGACIDRAAKHYCLLRLSNRNDEEIRRVRLNESKKIRKAITTRTRRLNAHWNRLLDNFMHEIKNPVAVIMGYANVLLKKSQGSSFSTNHDTWLGYISRNADQLQNLVVDLLDYRGLERGHKNLNRGPIEASELLGQMHDEFGLQARECNIHMVKDVLLLKDTKVVADTRRIRQVLMNLISNAIKFTPSGGEIRLGACHKRDEVLFWVHDNGVGIPESQCKKIFDRHFQGSRGRSKIASLGLGLEICKKLVELHGGSIWAQSRAGKGATFYFTLPAAVKKPAAPLELAYSQS